jgi:hypothetical protein
MLLIALKLSLNEPMTQCTSRKIGAFCIGRAKFLLGWGIESLLKALLRWFCRGLCTALEIGLQRHYQSALFDSALLEIKNREVVIRTCPSTACVNRIDD